jgi:hypothetical protein
MYKTDPKFFNQDGSINFDTACAAGRFERSKSAHKGIGSIWRKITTVAKAGKQQIGAMGESQSTGSLKTS